MISEAYAILGHDRERCVSPLHLLRLAFELPFRGQARIRPYAPRGSYSETQLRLRSVLRDAETERPEGHLCLGTTSGLSVIFQPSFILFFISTSPPIPLQPARAKSVFSSTSETSPRKWPTGSDGGA